MYLKVGEEPNKKICTNLEMWLFFTSHRSKMIELQVVAH